MPLVFLYIIGVKQNPNRDLSRKQPLDVVFCFTLDFQGPRFYNDLKSKAMSKKNEEKETGIMVFKSTFEYLMKKELSDEDFCILMRCIYNARWNGVFTDEDELPFHVRLIWRSLKHFVKKSIRNADDYENRQKCKEAKKNEIEPDIHEAHEYTREENDRYLEELNNNQNNKQ